MKSYRLLVLGTFMAVLGAAAWAQQGTWKRQYVGQSALSLESPVTIGQGMEEKVEDPKDWVGKMTDYIMETEDYYLQITVFEGKSGQANYSKLAEVMSDTVEVFADNAYTVKFAASADGESGTLSLSPVAGRAPKQEVRLTGSSVAKLDDAPMMRAEITSGKGDDETLWRFMLVGEGRTVYAVFGLAFPQNPESVKSMDRIMKSIRFKKGL